MTTTRRRLMGWLLLSSLCLLGSCAQVPTSHVIQEIARTIFTALTGRTVQANALAAPR